MTRQVLALGLVAGLVYGCSDKGSSDKDKGGTDDTVDDTNTGPVDADGDGYTVEDDCDDANDAINPAAAEVCDGADNNCDSQIDEATATDASTWYKDADSDGFGDASEAETACATPSGFVADSTDCDDKDAGVNPGATELCNGKDENCNDDIDDIDMSSLMFVTVDDRVNEMIYKVDLETGELTEVSELDRATKDYLIYALATSDAGGAWFHDTKAQNLYSLDICDGSSTLIGATGDNYLVGMTLGRDGEMYAVDGGVDALVKVDPVTAAVTEIGTLGISVNNCGLTYMCQTDRLILVNPTNDGTSIYQVDPETGATNLLMEADITTTIGGASYDPSSGRVIAVANNGLYSFDVDEGTAETIATYTDIDKLDNLGLVPLCP